MPRTKRNFTTAAELQDCVDGYFSMCDEHKVEQTVKVGREMQVVEVSDPLPYVFTRLAIVCGCTPRTLSEIQRRGEEDPAGPEGELAEVIAMARLRIEANLEERMLRGLGWGQGHVLALKNHYGWKDNVGVTGADGGPVVVRFDKQDEKL